jgi:hypothetical protein
VFRSSVDVFNDKNKGLLVAEFEIACSLDEAMSIIDGSFDGTILDLKLKEDEDGGNKIVEQLNESLLRVPVIFVTGYPDLVNEHPIIVKKRARGSEKYEDDLELIRDIKNTGLTHIMGGRGVIEKVLNDVFLKNLLPQKDKWVDYGKVDNARTERVLLRHTLNHLLPLLDEDEDEFFPEEVYIYPPLIDTLRTGGIVSRKNDKKYFVVLNPACDLVIRKNGNFKTDRILLVEIDDGSLVSKIKGIQSSQNKKELSRIKKCKHHHSDSESYQRVLKYQEAALRTNISGLFRNAHDLYHHWLPPTSFFKGGFLNFRKLAALSKQEFDEGFNPPGIQISPSFVKDIVARFSSFYARQGQPVIECDGIISSFIESSQESE